MQLELVLFTLLILFGGISIYILFRLWYNQKRDGQLRSFLLFGLDIAFWMVMSALVILVKDSKDFFPYVYTLRMVVFCGLPYTYFWFVLNFTGSSLVTKKWVKGILVGIVCINEILIVSNPLHYLFFSAYEYPKCPTGSLFVPYVIVGYVTVLSCFIALMIYVIKNARKKPMVLISCLGMFFPYVLNLLYNFSIVQFKNDPSPFAFFITILFFSFTLFRTGLFSFNSSALISIFQTLDDGVLVITPDHSILNANPAFLSMFPDFPIEIGSTSALELLTYFSSISASCTPAEFFTDIEWISSNKAEAEFTILEKHGQQQRTYRFFHHRFDRHGHVTGYVVKLSDVSSYRIMIDEIHSQNERLTELKDIAQQASQAKSDFLSNMSHEMRTPMNAIIGMTTIGRSSSDLERKDYSLDKISEASTHLLGVINDVLDMSKIEANKLELAPISFRFEKMLQKVVNVINFKIEERRQNFYVNVDARIPAMLYGDDQRLSQVIANLLSNAVKFTPEEGTIHLNTELIEEKNGVCTIQIEVVDSGIGITQEQQNRLFSSFVQADSSTSRKFGGTGLGLTISKRIVEMMNGKIWIESELGKGSKFAFIVQIQRDEEKRESHLNPGVNWSNIRVLTVDDDPEILEYFRSIATQLGIQCDCAASGQEAIELLKENDHYDIYFIDWRMPGMNGVELASYIKENCSRKNVVIMISAAEWSDIEKEAKDAGIDTFMSKPLFPSLIGDKISEYIGADGEEKPNTQKETLSTFEGRVILLAEDVEINRVIVMALLESTLVEIDCAENGAEALMMFNEHPERYDLIFMDMQMPEMDGCEATRAIRNLNVPTAKSVPIIAMTANVFREDIEKCIEAGMDDHIGKPLDMTDVMTKLRKYLTSPTSTD